MKSCHGVLSGVDYFISYSILKAAMDKKKRSGLESLNIRRKLIISFILMSIIPFMVGIYIVRGYIPTLLVDFKYIALITIISLWIILLGFYLANHIVSSVVNISKEAESIARGEAALPRLARHGRAGRGESGYRSEDEIGELSDSLARLTQKFKENMDTLRFYADKLRDRDITIHKRVLALSGDYEATGFLSMKGKLNDILRAIIEKLSDLEEGGIVSLFLTDNGKDMTYFAGCIRLPAEAKMIHVKLGEGVLGKAAISSEPTVYDAGAKDDAEIKDVKSKFGASNIGVFPISSFDKIVGVLVLGNNLSGYKYAEDKIITVNSYVNQIAIAKEIDTLIPKTEELAVIDELTTLYNERYITSHLEEEVQRARLYQKPCSFVVFNVDNFKQYTAKSGDAQGRDLLKKLSQVIQKSIAETDRAARLGGDEFALILPEVAKKQARGITEKICLGIKEEVFVHEMTTEGRTLTISAGISESPIDGQTAVELINKAKDALKKAKAQGKNQVVG